MRQSGMGIPVFQSHGFGNVKYVEQGGVACEGTLFPGTRVLAPNSLPEGHPQKALLATYKRSYEERFGEPAMIHGTDAYDALMIVVKAVEQGGTERETLRDTIENMKEHVGAGGVFCFSPEDHNGLGPEAFDMMVVRSSRFAFCRKPETPSAAKAMR
jgi:branched-chain amino acid transport system substrate-binding protein